MITRLQLALAAFSLVTGLIGCQSVGGLTDAEREQVKMGERVVVLLKVECVVDGNPPLSFESEEFGGAPLVLFGLGSFRTVLDPDVVEPRRLVEDSRRGGWIYFVLAPGTYHLAVLGPDTFVSATSERLSEPPIRQAPRWHMEVPEGAAFVHVGTLSFEAKSVGGYLFGERSVHRDPRGTISLRDESGEAVLVAARNFRGFLDSGDANPEQPTIEFSPLRRWHPGETKVIRTPRALTRRSVH
jgi:hypothetical protein